MNRYGIRITLPENDPLRQPHLLGRDWEGFRWYETAQQRDRAYEEMLQSPGYYRQGDEPSVVLTRVQR